jgi:hypothetical protein
MLTVFTLGETSSGRPAQKELMVRENRRFCKPFEVPLILTFASENYILLELARTVNVHRIRPYVSSNFPNRTSHTPYIRMHAWFGQA